MSTSDRAKNLFFEALGFIDSLNFEKAELRLREAMTLSPGSVSILTNLAVVLIKQNKLIDAREHAQKAVAAKSDNIEAMLVLAECYARDDNLTGSLDMYKAIISFNPGVAEVHNNMGIILQKSQRSMDALASFDQAIALEPYFVDAHFNRGNALRNIRDYEEALGAYDVALRLKPDFAEAWLCHGNVLATQARYAEACAAFRRAIKHKADLFEAVRGLAHLLLSEGSISEALDLARHALNSHETLETKALVASCLRSPLLDLNVGGLEDLLLRAISEPWARPSELAHTCARFLLANDAIRGSLAETAEVWPTSSLAMFAENRLLREVLESAPICDPALERFATGLRFSLLTTARFAADQVVAEPLLGLYCAIARQCFINNYVFMQTDDEIEHATSLRDTLVASIASGVAVPILSLVAVAAYFPLHALPRLDSLVHLEWPDTVKALLAQQVSAPGEEKRLRKSMPMLTGVCDGVSTEVRTQYEENPYPQWVKAAPGHTPKTVDVYIRERFPLSPLIERKRDECVDILVAGCGTGQHSTETARRFKGAQVLAVDLSMASLCYAERQRRALGLNNIQYAQADIMMLSSITQTFDVIEASGVLHHLADPLAGWRVLLSLLRPSGLMLLGLYSEAARRDIVAAQNFAKERAYRPIEDDIRRFRTEVLACADGTPLRNVTLLKDFFSLSECRDLLFHVQEQRFTLPKIAEFLAENNLQFLGFELDLQTSRDYARHFPSDISMTDLSKWHLYETNNACTFLQMYNFWVQKK
jgi:SAM-dependent methyltransferase/Tfp pilus assembly protein PilF